jgi:hypothetical protein
MRQNRKLTSAVNIKSGPSPSPDQDWPSGPTTQSACWRLKKAASRWSCYNWPSPRSSHAKLSRESFIAQAAGWMTFLKRLPTALQPVTVYDQMLTEFRSFMKEDRGLSPITVEYRCINPTRGALTSSPDLMWGRPSGLRFLPIPGPTDSILTSSSECTIR